MTVGPLDQRGENPEDKKKSGFVIQDTTIFIIYQHAHTSASRTRHTPTRSLADDRASFHHSRTHLSTKLESREAGHLIFLFSFGIVRCFGLPLFWLSLARGLPRYFQFKRTRQYTASLRPVCSNCSANTPVGGKDRGLNSHQVRLQYYSSDFFLQSI